MFKGSPANLKFSARGFFEPTKCGSDLSRFDTPNRKAGVGQRCGCFIGCQQQTEQTEPTQLLLTCFLSFKTQTDASFIYLPGDDGMVTG